MLFLVIRTAGQLPAKPKQIYTNYASPMVTFQVSCLHTACPFLSAPDMLPAGNPNGGSDLWLCDVSLFGDLQFCTGVLSAEELARARRFKFERDQNLYVAAHGLLRIILGKYLHVPPEEIAFASRPGKPCLADAPEVVQFNLSHTHGYVAVAVHRSYEIGVDVEKAERTLDWRSLVDYCLAPREQQVLAGLDPAAGRSTFYRYWTRKEAFLKAIGVGLIDRLPELIVVDGDQAVSLSSLKDAVEWERSWKIFTFELAPFLCSVAQPAQLPAPTCYRIKLPGT